MPSKRLPPAPEPPDEQPLRGSPLIAKSSRSTERNDPERAFVAYGQCKPSRDAASA